MLGSALLVQMVSAGPPRGLVGRFPAPLALHTPRLPPLRMQANDTAGVMARVSDGISGVNRIRDAYAAPRAAAASIFRVSPPYFDACLGCVVFSLLTRATSGTGDSTAGRVATIAVFIAVQSVAGVSPSSWLRYDEDSRRVDPNPLFQSGSPLAGVTFGFAFAIAVAASAQVLGIDWVPAAREWPEAARASLLLLVAPLSEEIFFRAWLLNALELAGATAPQGLLASAALFGLYQVPFGEVLNGGGLPLLFFEALGAYLAFLYQRSGGSLPLAIVTHCTVNALVTALRAAQTVGSLPFT